MLRAYSRDACSAMRLGRFSEPSIVTPLSVRTTSPAFVPSQLPPASAARSTITEPWRMLPTASAVISFGAGRPGISAVVITTSDFAICTCSAARCVSCSSGLSSRA